MKILRTFLSFLKRKLFKTKWRGAIVVLLALFLIGGSFFLWKAETISKKISGGGLMSTLIHNIPGVKDELKGEKDGRINVLLLGMRGSDMPGGGNLADTIILASIKPTENKLSMISIPRDLYVTVPGTQDKQKINAVYFYGEKKNAGQGLKDMETVVSEVTGLPISYTAAINFAGFKQLVDALGGVQITLEHPFEESEQFDQAHVCDSFFNVPTGEYENKTVKYFSKESGVYKTRVVASYPLCSAPKDTLECGGDFKLPAGTQTLDGEKALCYARARYTSSDFERSKRQQQIIKLVREKATSLGTLSDFSKVNAMISALGDNIKTDMEIWEIQRLYDLYKKMDNPQIYQRVLENSQEGLLYHPEPQDAAGYILLPIGGNYDKIHDMAQNIFTLDTQSDIEPK